MAHDLHRTSLNKRSDNSKIWKCIFITTSTQLLFILHRMNKSKHSKSLMIENAISQLAFVCETAAEIIDTFLCGMEHEQFFQHCNQVVFYTTTGNDLTINRCRANVAGCMFRKSHIGSVVSS